MIKRRHLLATAAAASAAAVVGCSSRPEFPEAAQKWPPVGRFVDAEGLKIHAWEQGQGRPVILMHGASGNLRDWTWDLGPKLAERYRVIAFDRPGLGYSERPAKDGGEPAVQGRVLRAAANAMGAERPILVGHSWGAAAAMAWALDAPEEVAGVVSVSGAVMPWSERPMLAELIGLDQLLIGFYFNYLSSSAESGGVERFVQRVFAPQMPPAGYVDHVGGPLAMRPKALKANKEDIGALNSALRRQAPRYSSLDLPVEVISGTEDFIINPERQPIPFAERLPQSRLTLLNGVGHMAHHAAPDVLAASIARIDQA
ncbi:MAG: alpha/beta hydrolase [Pseudomonadota bacterium]